MRPSTQQLILTWEFIKRLVHLSSDQRSARCQHSATCTKEPACLARYLIRPQLMRLLEHGKADLQIAISHDTQTVAVPAEGLGHGGDEGDRALEAWHSEVLRHLCAGVLHVAGSLSGKTTPSCMHQGGRAWSFDAGTVGIQRPMQMRSSSKMQQVLRGR